MLKKTLVSLVFIAGTTSNAQSLHENLVFNGNFAQSSQGWALEQGIEVAAPPIPNSNDLSSPATALLMHAQEALVDGYIHSRKARQCIPIGNARKLQFSGDFFYPDDLPASSYGHRANLIWHYNADCSGGAQFGWFLEPDIKNGWQALIIEDLNPALNAQAVEIEITQDQQLSRKDFGLVQSAYYWLLGKLDMVGDDTLARGYWDNFNLHITEFEEPEQPNNQFDGAPSVPTNTNLLRNGGFDTGLEHWKHYHSEWRGDEGYLDKGAIRITLTSDSGSMGTGVFEQCVNIGYKRQFKMGVSFKADEKSNQTGGGRMRVSWYEQENCQGRHSTDNRHVDPQKIAGWQRLYVPLLEPARNSRSVSVDAIQTIDGKGEFSAYWDDMYFMAIE